MMEEQAVAPMRLSVPQRQLWQLHFLVSLVSDQGSQAVTEKKSFLAHDYLLLQHGKSQAGYSQDRLL